MGRGKGESRETSRTLDVELTEQEIADAGRKLAEVVLEIETMEEDKRASARAWREKIKAAKKESDRLSRIVDDGVEARTVDCEMRPDYERNCWRVIRKDTKELVDEVAMTAEDRQATIAAVE